MDRVSEITPLEVGQTASRMILEDLDFWWTTGSRSLDWADRCVVKGCHPGCLPDHYPAEGRPTSHPMELQFLRVRPPSRLLTSRGTSV